MPDQVGGPRKPKLFDDVMIAGAELVATHRVLAGLRLFPPRDQDRSWYLSQVTASVPGRIQGKTVWWRVRYRDGARAFINVDPGEFRTEEPSGDVLFLDVPDVPAHNECRDLIAAALQTSQSSLVTDPLHREMLSVARQFLDNPDALHKAGQDRVRAIVPLMREADAERVAEPLGSLVFECLTCARLDQRSFAASMLLLQLQRMVAEWIQQDFVANPVGMLGAFLELVNQGAKRDRLSSACEEIAGIEYAEGRRLLTEALDAGSLFSMGRQLAGAHHRFQMVQLLDREARACGLQFRRPRPEIVIEESLACTITGLGYGAVLMSEHPGALATELLRRIRASGGDEVETAVDWGSSHVHPFVNRYFARILAAQAMTLAEEPGKVKRGLNSLLDLRQSLSPAGFSDDIQFERGWIDQALLRAYKTLGMEAEAKRIATSIAGRLMISRLLASESDPDAS
jgi:hypothetical protein